jgi:hypothetical protein
MWQNTAGFQQCLGKSFENIKKRRSQEWGVIVSLQVHCLRHSLIFFKMFARAGVLSLVLSFFVSQGSCYIDLDTKSAGKYFQSILPFRTDTNQMH